MVRKEEFCNEVMERAMEYYEDRAKVSMHDVIKNNNQNKKGLCVTLIGGNCGPTIYLDDYYEEYESGRDFQSVFNDIINLLDRHLVEEKVDFSFFTDFDRIRDRIFFRLIGAKKNETMLKECPHRIIEDLAVTYYVSTTSMGIEGSVAIRDNLMVIWNASEEDLFEAALDNTPRLYPAEVIPMSDILKRKTGQDFEDYDFLSHAFLVGSNEKNVNGASVILYPGLLREVSKHFGGGFYIIPSSVHETLFVKELAYKDDPETLVNMIHCVNESCVLPEDVLSDSLYCYDAAAENNIKKVEQVKDTMVL